MTDGPSGMFHRLFPTGIPTSSYTLFCLGSFRPGAIDPETPVEKAIRIPDSILLQFELSEYLYHTVVEHTSHIICWPPRADQKKKVPGDFRIGATRSHSNPGAARSKSLIHVLGLATCCYLNRVCTGEAPNGRVYRHWSRLKPQRNVVWGPNIPTPGGGGSFLVDYTNGWMVL